MNPFFWLVIVIALILLWFLLSFAFKWIGGIALKIYHDAIDEFEDEEKEKQE